MEVQKVVDNLKVFLLADDVGENIAKIFLFGSQAKDTARPNSDIDILIVTNDGEAREQRLLDRVYDFMIENNAPIEVMTAHVNDLAVMQDYFLYNVVTYGTEVYAMEQKVIKRQMANNLLDLGEEYLESAEDVFTLNRTRLAIDGAYNAAELATKALILLKQDDLPGSHGGVASLFGQLYVLTGDVDRQIGRALNRSLKFRNEARYKPNSTFSQENVRFVLDLAKTLLDLGRRLVEEKN